MGKLAIVRFDGDFDTVGFRVTLEIGPEGDRPSTEIPGRLPPAPELKTLLEQWETKYRNIDAARGIKPKQIIYNGSINQRIEECRAAANRLSEGFQEWLEAKAFRPIDRTLREELARDEATRILIRSENPQIQKLPWHLWDFFERYPQTELGLLPPYAQRIKTAPQRQGAVKILAILGHQEDINVEADRQLLENLPNARVTFLVEPSHEQINDQLWQQSWQILFFAGHSTTESDRGCIYINPTERLTIADLKYGLKKALAGGLQFAIFNSCDGLGLARELAQLHIPQTIVMREPVPDRVAQTFLKYFLLAFSGGNSFYLAMREARERLQGLEGEFPCATWLPIVCQNTTVVPKNWAELVAAPTVERVSGNWEGKLSRSPWTIPFIPSPPQPWIHSWRKPTALLFLLALCIWGGQVVAPKLATTINNRAFEDFQAGRWREFQPQIQLAIALDPHNAAAHYSRGWSCEQVRNFDCARTHYQIAARYGFAAAYSQLARLSIVEDGDYDAAVEMSGRGLQFAIEVPVKYALHKNLGWARLEQGRYEEAIQQLQMAIALDDDRAAAYCLMARVLERSGASTETLVQWEMCYNLANPQDFDEDRWLGMARKRLFPPPSPSHF